MSVEDARELYEAIGEDESLQSRFEELESEEEVIDTMLVIGENREIDASRSDVAALFEELADKAEQLDEEELEKMAGGNSEYATGCKLRPVGVPGYSWCAGHPELAE